MVKRQGLQGAYSDDGQVLDGCVELGSEGQLGEGQDEVVGDRVNVSPGDDVRPGTSHV